MMNFRILRLTIAFISIVSALMAQAPSNPAAGKMRPGFYGTCYHQHHDFFDKAFSFQGLEAGAIVRRKIFIGVYAAFFASNLKINTDNGPEYIWMGQTGFSSSGLLFENKRIHPGIELKAGLFTLRRDSRNFGFFEATETPFRLNGWVLSPQVFGEFMAVRWLGIRAGLSYNFYGFRGQSSVRTTDLNHISFTFGIVFQKKQGGIH